MSREVTASAFSGIYLGRRDEVADAGGVIIEIGTTEALNVGDPVYVSGDETVGKSATAADYMKFVGVVVGGDLTGMRLFLDSDDLEKNAASNAGRALVMIHGICYVKANAAVAAGGAVEVAVTEAEVDDVATPTHREILGIALAAASADAAVKLLIQHH